jgi:hypothetical protein
MSSSLISAPGKAVRSHMDLMCFSSLAGAEMTTMDDCINGCREAAANRPCFKTIRCFKIGAHLS